MGKKHIDEIFEKLNWEKAWREVPSNSCQTRYEDDSVSGSLNVVFSCDGDSWVEIIPDTDKLNHSLRFREPMAGGGESVRVRKALMVLALAIKADNEERPQRRFPLKGAVRHRVRRPIFVDLELALRIIGESKSSYHISTDEGDGYDFVREGGAEPEKKHYMEWIEQLRHIIKWLEQKAI